VLSEEKGYPIAALCELVQLNRSSYYKWLRRDQSEQEQRDKELIDCMCILHQESNGIFGYRRMQLNLERRFELRCNKKQIYRVMRAIGMQSVIRKMANRCDGI
jgi:predicted NUDIX family phosphoesterase